MPAGALVAGTAQVTVNGNDLGQFHVVKCSPAGNFLTISTGNDEQGSTAIVSNADGLTAKSVAIRDLGGFTGSFNQGLGGNATVSLDGATYTITGALTASTPTNPASDPPAPSPSRRLADADCTGLRHDPGKDIFAIRRPGGLSRHILLG